MPHTVVVDDAVPMFKNTEVTNYAGLGKDNSMWMPIVEKAFAKLMGNYLHIEGGVSRKATIYLTGAPMKVYYHHKYDKEVIWRQLVEKDREGYAITTGTKGKFEGIDGDCKETGLVRAHAFTVLSAHTLSNGVRLVCLRNPWGGEVYKGPWSANDSRWTAQLRSEVPDWGTDNDGIFYTTLDIYIKYFDVTDISLETEGMHFDYFLMLDDKTERDGEFHARNRRHYFTL